MSRRTDRDAARAARRKTVFGSTSLQTIGGRLADLVHESARRDPRRAARHERFIATRIAIGALALTLAPVYLAVWHETTTPVDYLALCFLVAPMLAALVLSRTGSLGLAHTMSAGAFAGLVVVLAAGSGGIASPFAIWLAVVPLEALLSSSRRAALGATFLAGLAVLVLFAIEPIGLASDQLSALSSSIAVPMMALFAIAHVGSLVVAVSRSEGEQRVEESRRDARDRSLLEALDDLVTWHDANGHVVKASPAAMKLVGVPSLALEERGLFARVHVQDRPAYLKALSDAAIGSVPALVELRLHFGDALDCGRVVWAEMRAWRVEGQDDNCRVVAVLRDVTERKAREAELDDARRKSARADAVKTRFLATVSHELRTPLNAIIGFSELLGSPAGAAMKAAQRQEYAHIIHESGHHLLEVVNSLLDMSQIESGNFDFAPAAFPLPALLESVVTLLRLKAEAKSVVLQCDVEGSLPEIVADRRACRQILINLVSNAVKFTPGGGTVEISVRRRGERVVLCVSDTGIGVPEYALPRLGDPFYQVNAAYDRPHEGTGLGLSVVRGLVGLHQGSMAIESAPGIGTRVTVELPLDGCSERTALTGAGAPIPIHTRARAAGPVDAAGETSARPRSGDADSNEEFKRSA